MLSQPSAEVCAVQDLLCLLERLNLLRSRFLANVEVLENVITLCMHICFILVESFQLINCVHEIRLSVQFIFLCLGQRLCFACNFSSKIVNFLICVSHQSFICNLGIIFGFFRIRHELLGF